MQVYMYLHILNIDNMIKGLNCKLDIVANEDFIGLIYETYYKMYK